MFDPKDSLLSTHGVRTTTNFRIYKEPFIEENTVINNYRFIKLIGVGGFGEVYQAENIVVHRPVAIKVYETFGDPNAILAFKRGANYLAQLNHPHVATMYDFFSTDNYLMMVMELFPSSTTLRQLVGSFTTLDKFPSFLNLFESLLDTLRYCHEKRYTDIDGSTKSGIFHGDIKPDNIFLVGGSIKISDFMLPNLEPLLKNRFVKENFPYNDTRAYGTPMYMSPEQMNGRVTAQTDIYNIGITAFEILTGYYPYESEYNFRKNTPKSLAEFNSSSPEWLNTIIQRCIANKPESRYKTIANIETDMSRSRQAFSKAHQKRNGFRFFQIPKRNGIFLSYRRVDGSEIAARLYDELQTQVHARQVFIDVVNIEPGDDFVMKIDDAILRSSVMLVIIGTEWMKMVDDNGFVKINNPWDYVRIELSHALAGGLKLIPILVNNAEPLNYNNLPENIRQLARLNAVVINPANLEEDLTTVIQIIK